MKNNRNNYIGKMRKGFKQKLSLLMIACLLFTGFHGLTISGRAETPQKEQNNEIEVNGSQVKVQLLGEDLRRAATEAILKGEKLGKSNLLSYSKDQDLATEFEEYFDGEKEIYPVPLNSISENLEESLAEEEAGLQIYVERDAKNLERLVRQESKESLLLYSKESAVAKLLPRAEEKTSVEKEEKASDSELIRDTELTGSELITFVYENKSEQKMTFQLSVDGNRYPKVSVAPKASLFKQFLSDAKKAQAEAKKNEGKEEKKEQASVSATEESKVEEKEAVAELKASEEAKQEESKEASDVELVSTAAEEHKEETQSVEAKEEKPESTEEKKEETVAESEAEKAEASVESTQAEEKQSESKAKESKTEDKSLLKEITENSEEFLPELQSVRFIQYSLNELGRKSQNVEIEGFGNVQVFYEEAAFEDKDVVLEAKRLFKREEEVEGEKLTEEQEKVLKEHSIYDDAASLDIRFVDKKDSAKEVEPKSPVSVRISIDKKALPAEVSPDAISIHHLVEDNETKAIEKVEVVVQPSVLNSKEVLDSEETSGTLKTEEDKNDTITKEFVVDSFSLYQINWTDDAVKNCPPIIFHYVDKNFNEIGPTVRKVYKYKTGLEKYIKKGDKNDSSTWQIEVPGNAKGDKNIFDKDAKTVETKGEAYKTFRGYDFVAVYPYRPGLDNLDKIVNGGTDDYFDLNYKYNGHEGKDFSSGISKIDNLGYTLNGQRYVWYTLVSGSNHYNKNCATEFYFVYDTKTNDTKKRTEEEIETKQDKYIKDNQDGTYDLTLSAQVKKKSKPEKLDIVFLVETTKTMDATFDTKNKKTISRREAVQDHLSEMVTILSKNSNYDLRFGLVGFGGGKTDNGTTISDTAFNDVTYIGGFTNSASNFNNMLANLPESEDSQTGPNYTAAIMGARRLLDGSFGPTKDGKPSNFAGGIDRNVSSTARPDANKIIVLIADNDPVYSYVLEDGVYDETRKTSGELKSFTASLQKGYSYGNGVDFSRVALNQARGFLAEYNKDAYTAFYTIGIGDEDNWKHLKELTQAHGPSEFTGDDHRRWEVVPDTNHGKFIRAKSALLKGADSKIFDGSTPKSLKSSIIELGQKIAPNATELTITDTLSENVTLVNDIELKAEVFKMKANGVDTDGGALTEPQRKELGLNGFILEKPKPPLQQGGEIKLTTDPSDFSLPAGYEIRLTATIKPSAKAYEKLSKGEASENTGGERTDLQNIYKNEKLTLPDIYKDANKYGTSAGKKGLFTNDDAKFKYKWKGSDREKEYPKPIIKVQGAEVKLIKQVEISGFTESDYLNNNDFSPMLKSVLKDITFVVYEVEPNSKREYFSFKPFKEGISENQAEEGFILAEDGKRQIKREKAKYDTNITLSNNEKYLRLEYTITGLDPKKKYEISEKISTNRYIHSSQKGKQEYWYVGKLRNHVEFNPVETKKIIIQNLYTSEKKDIQITKEVKNKFTGFKLHPDDKSDVFDLYLKVYHPVIEREQNGDPAPGQPKSLTKDELSKIKDDNPGVFLQDIEEVPADKNVPEGTVEYALHFQLKNGESKKIKLYGNQSYKVLEKKPTGYELAKFATSNKETPNNWGTPEEGTEIKDQKNEKIWFSSRRYDVLCPGNLKIINTSTRELPIPTGIVRDITPYLFGIFGFVAMAGAYLTISKKRREA